MALNGHQLKYRSIDYHFVVMLPTKREKKMCQHELTLDVVVVVVSEAEKFFFPQHLNLFVVIDNHRSSGLALAADLIRRRAKCKSRCD
jgi:hypothetical protein